MVERFSFLVISSQWLHAERQLNIKGENKTDEISIGVKFKIIVLNALNSSITDMIVPPKKYWDYGIKMP